MPDLSIITTINITANYTNSLDLTTPRDAMDLTYQLELEDGVSTDQADVLWHDTRQIAASSADTINLKSLTAAFGAVAFAKVKHLSIYNRSATRTLTVGAASSTAWAGPFGSAANTLSVQPGETKVLINTGIGYSVTSSTNNLKIANNSASSIACSYDIIIAGTSS